VTYERFEVLVVPFPFTDRDNIKRRPALVISDVAFNSKAGHSVMAMITSASNPPWPADVAISDITAAGLPAPSVVRMKLFTLDHRLIIKRSGTLSAQDAHNVLHQLKRVIAA